MFESNITKIAEIGNSPIKSMFIELAQLDVDLRATETDLELGEVLDRHWAVREQIATTPVLNLRDAVWMARAAKLEEERDPRFTNDAPGSASHLASLAVAGLIRFAGSAK
jgi:hypothetical protein